MRTRSHSRRCTSSLLLFTTVLAALPFVSCGAVPEASGPPAPPVWAPSPSDFRFQGVGAGMSAAGMLFTNLGGGIAYSFPRSWGGPIQMGNGICAAPPADYHQCSWFFEAYSYNPGSVLDTTAVYLSGAFTNLASFPTLGQGVFDLSGSNLVVRSLDVQPANNGYALAYTTSPSATGFSPSFQHMYLTNLQAFASSEGLQGRVVTALSVDSATTAYVFSYGWANDTTSIYEASVASVTVSTVGSVAQQMASEGYVITAFGAGGNPVFGWYLVGTRLQGSTSPRAIFVSSPNRPSDALYYSQGYVDVATIYDNPAPNVSTRIWIVEK